MIAITIGTTTKTRGMTAPEGMSIAAEPLAGAAGQGPTQPATLPAIASRRGGATGGHDKGRHWPLTAGFRALPFDPARR